MANSNDKSGKINDPEDSFKDLMDEFENKISEIEIDKKIIGKVIEKKGEFTYLDLGGRLDGRIMTNSLESEREYSEGDQVEVYVTGVKEGFYSCQPASEGLSENNISGSDRAPGFDEGSLVFGKITGHNKGGFEVNVRGTSCFSPFSKMDRGAGEDPDAHVGRELKFSVEEIDVEKERYILSRREIIRSEKEKKKDEFINSLEKGKIYKGTVKSIMKYGAFVEVGEVEGLLHISDISHEKIEDVNKVLKIGDEIDVVLKNKDDESGKISFSRKELIADPWNEFSGKYKIGDKIAGRVETLKPYGAFVNVFPGISGLLHISKLGTGKFHKHPKEVFKVGDKIDVWIDKIDTVNKKISLTGSSPEEDFSGRLKKINEESENMGKASASNAFGEMLDKALSGKK